MHVFVFSTKLFWAILGLNSGLYSYFVIFENIHKNLMLISHLTFINHLQSTRGSIHWLHRIHPTIDFTMNLVIERAFLVFPNEPQEALENTGEPLNVTIYEGTEGLVIKCVSFLTSPRVN